MNAKFICQDIRTITFNKEFDVVLNMADGAIGYLEDDGENHKIFSVIAKAIKNGGKHFMDIMNGSYAQTHFPCKLWDAGEKGLCICNSFADFSGKPSSDNDIQLMVYSIRE